VLLITEDPADSSLDALIHRTVNDPAVETIHTKISTGILQI
jgi:hypothetical protein